MSDTYGAGDEPEFEDDADPDFEDDAGEADDDAGFEDDEGDLGDEDDEGEPDGDGQDDQPDHDARGGGRSRGASRFDRLRQERDQLRRELDAARRTPSQPDTRQQVDPHVAAQRRQEYLDSLTPDQRVEFLNQETRQLFSQQLQQMQFQNQDIADKAAFDALCRTNPAAAKLKTKVEERLAAERAKGFNYPRDVILKFTIGERALNGAPKAKTRQERQAAEQRQRHQGRPNGGRSDVQGGDRRASNEKEARRKRLEDMQI